MKEIGSLLKEAREKKNLSIQDVAQAIKINSKTLQAIEDGDSENLPAKPFLRGFVQSYARYLELNVDEVMKKFLEIAGTTKPKPQITDDAKEEQIDHEEVQNKFELYKKIAYGVAAVIAIVLVYFIQQVVSKYEQESKIAREQQEAVKSQTQTEGNEGNSEETASNEETTPDSAETPAAAAETKSEEKKVVEEKKAEESKSEVTAATPKPQTPPLVVAPPTPPAQPTPKPETPTTQQAVAPAPTQSSQQTQTAAKPEEKKPTSRPQQVIIEALDNVEVRYSKDGESERTVKLKPEQFLTIKANSKISLNVSDSGAVNIIHNGRDKGVPGNLGQPSKLNYP